MGRVFTLHGTARGVRRGKFVYRNVSDEAMLTPILATREPFVPLADAIAGRGDALTIDDATRASGAAALLARRYGHAVSLFVNPSQVDPPRPYSFHLLSALMDRVKGRVTLDRESFSTRTFAQRERLRARLKRRLRETRAEDDRVALIGQVASEWSIDDLAVPTFLETLGVDDLRLLLDAGIDIQNHGWSHTCHRRLTAADSAREIELGREWLRDRLGVDARAFVVPYGDVFPKNGALSACDVWFTVNHRYPGGVITPGVWNREHLENSAAWRPRFSRVSNRFSALCRMRIPFIRTHRNREA